jgi:hypothetical protein
MKQAIIIAVVIISLQFSNLAQVRIKSFKITGEVIAYIKSDFLMKPHGFVPNGEEFIVKVKRSKNNKEEYIKLLNEYLEDKSDLPENIYSGKGRWKFTVTRRVDCDLVLRPDYSALTMTSNNNDKEKWIMDEPPKVNFIRPEEEKNIPSDKVLPCYLILSLKKN